MNGTQITCPHCAGEIELAEALAPPLLAEMENDILHRMQLKESR